MVMARSGKLEPHLSEYGKLPRRGHELHGMLSKSILDTNDHTDKEGR